MRKSAMTAGRSSSHALRQRLRPADDARTTSRQLVSFWAWDAIEEVTLHGYSSQDSPPGSSLRHPKPGFSRCEIGAPTTKAFSVNV